MPAPIPYVEDVRELLEGKGISLPLFPQFVPDDQAVSVALLQPKGDIVADENGVRNANLQLAIIKTRQFLSVASQRHANIAAAPEYSCPWEIIDEIASGVIPVPETAIWCLGCEAISIEALRQKEANSADQVIWLFEAPEGHRDQGQRFLDPLCIVMRGVRDGTQQSVIVIVVQFKTEPMGGTAFEQSNMVRGARIYQLRNSEEYSIRFVCLLCSDVLQCPGQKFERLAEYFDKQHRLQVLHLQLNGEPRHHLYRPCRGVVLKRIEGREVIALNWARDVVLVENGNAAQPISWKNPSMSAIYSRRWRKEAMHDGALDECERRGLYFCYSPSLRATVAILNFNEYLFVVRLSKVSQEDVDASHRTYDLPHVDATLRWDPQASVWSDEPLPVEGGAPTEMALAHFDPTALGGLDTRPTVFERLAALSLGKLGLADDVRRSGWPCIDSVDANCLDDAETILRTTFAQDPIDAAKEFRRERYLQLQRFTDIRQGGHFPRHMAPFADHALSFQFDLPYSNLRSADGRPGTAIYLNTGNEDDANLLYTRVVKHLQLLSGARVDKDHVVIWFLGGFAPAGLQVLAYPPDSTPRVTDDPAPSINGIGSTP